MADRIIEKTERTEKTVPHETVVVHDRPEEKDSNVGWIIGLVVALVILVLLLLLGHGFLSNGSGGGGTGAPSTGTPSTGTGQ